MDERNKGSVLFKYKPQDFIVEEITSKGICKVSQSPPLEAKKPMLGDLNVTDRRDFIMCDLEKYEIDHFRAITIIAERLDKQIHQIGYAGTKDKVAWTCQRISIFNPNVEKLTEFAYPGIILKNCKWGRHKIKIGDLEGNRFKVILRDIDANAQKMASRIKSNVQLPNFFGAQRFGSLRKDNVKLGTLILKNKFEQAVLTYLTGYGENESEEVMIAKRRFSKDKNWDEAQRGFPSSLVKEREMLQHLRTHPQDWKGALEVLGEKTLLIICQSVQSKLFNDILEKMLAQKINLAENELTLIGYDSHFSQGALGDIEKEVLSSYNLSFKDFIVKEIPYLTLKCSKRKAFFQVKDVEIQTENDEYFPPSKKLICSFSLDSGVYATTFLENFFELRYADKTEVMS